MGNRAGPVEIDPLRCPQPIRDERLRLTDRVDRTLAASKGRSRGGCERAPGPANMHRVDPGRFEVVDRAVGLDQYIERPGAASATRASTKSIRVSIDRTGTITMDNVPVRPWMVQSRVREGLAAGADGSVLVVTDRRVSAEKLIEVVDQCRLAGASDVGVVTDIERGEAGG